MGLVSHVFTLAVGIVAGIYISQKYNVPDVRSTVDDYLESAKRIEQSSRK